MRLFVALAVPPQVDDALDRAERDLRAWARVARVRLTWVPAGARHVTVRFVGERPDADDLVDAVERAAARLAAPTLRLTAEPCLLGAAAVAVPVTGADQAAAAAVLATGGRDRPGGRVGARGDRGDREPARPDASVPDGRVPRLGCLSPPADRALLPCRARNGGAPWASRSRSSTWWRTRAGGCWRRTPSA